MKVGALIPAAGLGERMGRGLEKQFLPLAGMPVLAHTLAAFDSSPSVGPVVVVVRSERIDYCRREVVQPSGCKKVRDVVAGGGERQDSVRLGLEVLADVDVVVIHDAVRPLVSSALIEETVERSATARAVVAAVPAVDSPKEVSEGIVLRSLDRHRIWLAQTPQTFERSLIEEAHRKASAEGYRTTDDAALAEWFGIPVGVVRGSPDNIKITSSEDLAYAEWVLNKRGRAVHPRERAGGEAAVSAAKRLAPIRAGIGYDVHPFVAGRCLVLGGVEIDHPYGLGGHSDADALTHAVADALLGAAALGDIGSLFPDSDPAYRGISSLVLLEKVHALLGERGLAVENVDATVLAERPLLAPYVEEMQMNIAARLGIPRGRISVKATRGEGLGFVGRGEGIAAMAIAVLIERHAI
jgi:2-C-methyl-D-erythritol 4-phosphate cytidylyltransferase/2-C-methyl-D-erythritol 2,4-cyclodiphosphate synthase